MPGVVITALVTGTVAYAAVFDIPLSTGLLIGAVLAPTDPAILIPLFDRIGIRQKIEQTAIAESALNDATGAVLALVLVGRRPERRCVHRGSGRRLPRRTSASRPCSGSGSGSCSRSSSPTAAPASGRSRPRSRSSPSWRSATSRRTRPVEAATSARSSPVSSSGTWIVSGSGCTRSTSGTCASLVCTITDVVVILVFITLGANLPWSDIWDNLGPALGVVVVGLLLLARPITVLICLGLDRRGRWTRAGDRVPLVDARDGRRRGRARRPDGRT